MTDGAPAMVERTRAKARAAGLDSLVTAESVALEDLEAWGGAQADDTPFDGAFSNFASLNCVTDHAAVARGLARVLPRGARALLVVFGPALARARSPSSSPAGASARRSGGSRGGPRRRASRARRSP